MLKQILVCGVCGDEVKWNLERSASISQPPKAVSNFLTSKYSSSATSQNSMAPLYARYVPPKKTEAAPVPKKPTPVHSSSTNEVATSAEGNDVNGRKKRKRTEEEEVERKARKEQKKTQRNGVTKDVSSLHNGNADEKNLTTHEQEESSISKPEKTKKRKRKQTDSESETTNGALGEVSDGVDEPSKHGSVMAKYQKAAERSTALQAGGGPDEEDAETRELHGM